MKTLHILRHAKSSWDDPSLDDDERPLAPRGRRAAAAMSEHLHRARLEVDLVLVSPARRTRETWDRVSEGVPARVTRVEPDIYAAGDEELLRIVRDTDDDVASLVVVGHNPTCHSLTTSLAGGGDERLLAALEENFPTGAFATLVFDGEWRNVAPGTGRLVGFVRPRELE